MNIEIIDSTLYGANRNYAQFQLNADLYSELDFSLSGLINVTVEILSPPDEEPDFEVSEVEYLFEEDQRIVFTRQSHAVLEFERLEGILEQFREMIAEQTAIEIEAELQERAEYLYECQHARG